MKAHRTLLIKLLENNCDIDYIKRLMGLTNLAYRDFEVLVPDLPKNIQYQLVLSIVVFSLSIMMSLCS
jgi:hypothetical protein